MIFIMDCYTKLAIVGGLILSTVSLLWPTILSTLMYKELKLSPGSKSFQHWEETPVPMYIDIYFHNWTNPEKILTEKPMFMEMGPYRFYEKRTKVNLTWNENGTVSYRQTRHWFFDAEHSNGSLQDNVTTVNMIPVVMAHKVRFSSIREQKALSWGFTHLSYEVDIVKTVEELLFKGYSDSFLTILKFLPKYSREVTDKFGWFYQRNGSSTADGLFNMDTGSTNLDQVGKIRSWNYKNHTGYFQGKCGEVSGGSGEVFPPRLSPKDRVSLFSADLCRTINLDYEEDQELDGIKGLKFSGGTDLVDSGIVDPETSCYQNGDPTPLGVLNLTECRLGAPIFISYPHFYHADPKVQNHVGGMKPNKDLHSFDITVEPTLGVPIDIKARFQVNILLPQLESFLLFRDIPEKYYMPILWFDQRASLSAPLSNEVKLMVELYHVSNSIALGLFVIGLVLAAGGVTWACRSLNKAPSNKFLRYTAAYSLTTTNPKNDLIVVTTVKP